MPDYQLSPKGARALLGFEGMMLTVYLDQAGIATTCGGHVVQGADYAWINDADGITRADCERVLTQDVGRFMRAISKLVTARISQPMADALCSLAYNIGEAAFERSSVLRYLNQGRYNDAADAFLLWKNVRVKQKDGSYVVKPILLGRRQAEAALFRSGILEAMGAAPSDGPSLETLLAYARSKQFGLFELLPERLPIESEPSNDVIEEDGRLVALPPRAEDNEPLAA